ncbi:MAG: HNH endonuclease [Bdellovibrionaceae bacterium]|nr:HNH endonuclease [Pseudobdellovibrionaceae bacterium]MBX3032346.1 HNH endonuclease [Pseudobdellovibrionaceae bacterium]
MSDLSDWYVPASPEHQKREKAKARELRQSQWWKQQRGRGICHYCEGRFPPAELTMDHVIPVARGGLSNKKNCVPCCKACNTKKGAKTTAELALETLAAPSVAEDE